MLQSRNPQYKPAVQTSDSYYHLNPLLLWDNISTKEVGLLKINPAIFRYVVRFNAVENGVFLTKYEKSGAVNKSAFIKDVLLGKSFKVFVVDQNTREFIDMLSSLNARYRTFVIDYDLAVKTLRENFTENKALKALYKLERVAIEIVKLNMEIVNLANRFDAEWMRNSNEKE